MKAAYSPADDDNNFVIIDVSEDNNVDQIMTAPTATTTRMMPPPPPMSMSMSGSSYHPDFMFCGDCTTCQDHENNNDNNNGEEESLLEDYLTSKVSEEYGDYSVVIRSRFHLDHPIGTPSHVLVIQSLLQPLPGVSKVIMERTTNQVIVDHDAQTSTESILAALDSVGHKAAYLQAPLIMSSGSTESPSSPRPRPQQDEQPQWVRSQFFVKGICCASEVPAVRKIVHSLRGVSKLQINITTKIVYVQHDLTQATAQLISKTLSKQGFPSKIAKDGQVTAQVKQQASMLHQQHARSTLHVQGVLTEQDIGPIQQRLSRISGISKIGVNVSESVIYIDHDVHAVTSHQCAEQLVPHYTCKVVIAAERALGDATAMALDAIGRSKYVESTLSLAEMTTTKQLHAVQKAIVQSFIRAQVRAIYPNVVSRTIKVEHDPKFVSILDVCNTLSSYGFDTATVAVDGADLNMYLPLQEDYPGFGGSNSNNTSMEGDSIWMHANVVLSGVFWVVSMIGLLGGMWYVLYYKNGTQKVIIFASPWTNNVGLLVAFYFFGFDREDLKYFGLFSVAFGLPPICVKAWRTLRRWQFDANCMMVIAAMGACALQEFDEAASVAFLFAVSEFLEARATQKARKALTAICQLRPDHANVIHPVTKEIVVVPADRVPLGSLICVKTGDKIAADGIVVEGSSAVDESSLTGEAKPSHKQVDDTVSGGTINIGSTQLVVRTTTTVDDSAVSRLIRLVEEAQSNRSPTEKMIDTFARSYTPAVVFLAALMCTLPWLWGREVGRYWTLNGLIIIVIACPCALTISTPVTYAAALAATAQRGIIVKGGANLEAMGSVDKVIFDKTGTLTQGKFTVVNLEVIGTNKTRKEMLQLLSLLQGRSSHPLSATLVNAAKKEGIAIPTNLSVTDHSILKGEGVNAKIDGIRVYSGNQRLFERLGMFDNLEMHYKELVENWTASGCTVGFLGVEEHGIIGAFSVKDVVRDEARDVIKGLRDAGIEVVMCTGDSHAAAHAVAKEVGISRDAVHSQLLPEDKLHFVGSLKRPQPNNFPLFRNRQYVAFCGDGVNDGPALAVSDVGISMGEGAAMAMEMSDITLMDSNLTKLSYCIEMGRRVIATIKENIAFSLAAKLAVVVLTFAGKMTLLTAIAADVGVMLIVTLNGMKLLPGVVDPSTFNQVTSLKMKSPRKNDEREDVELTSPKNSSAEIV
jgi:Cd2+/Zn2+-exporting ATPase